MPSKIDLTGQRFGRLRVDGEAPHGRNGRRKVNCTCDCGASVVCDPRSLRQGHTRSCGCFHRDRVAAVTTARCTTHGESGTKEYNTWIKIKGRCSNLKDAKFKDYGGRGIVVCDRWALSFDAFLEDMGHSPSPSHSIERQDVNGDYEPGNCVWATPLQQARNKRNHRMVVLGDRQMPLSEACEAAGVNYRSALYRLNVGRHWMPLPPPPEQGSSNV